MLNVTNPTVMKELLARYGFHFSKSKGQNFLTQRWVPQRIAEDYGVTGFSVERDARTALRQVPPELCCEVLNSPVYRENKPVTVRIFVSLCVIKLRYSN